MLSLS